MTTLADDLAQLLDGELSGFSCNTLALVLRRRRRDVLAVLHTTRGSSEPVPAAGRGGGSPPRCGS